MASLDTGRTSDAGRRRRSAATCCVIERLSGHGGVCRVRSSSRSICCRMDAAIDPTKLLRKPMTVTVELDAGGQRLFHGIGAPLRAARARARTISCRIAPRSFRRSGSCRVDGLPHLSEDVGAGHREGGLRASIGVTDFALRSRARIRTREYCVQYRETDFDFVSRLIEEEGIFYFFEHTAATSTRWCSPTRRARSRPGRWRRCRRVVGARARCTGEHDHRARGGQRRSSPARSR